MTAHWTHVIQASSLIIKFLTVYLCTVLYKCIVIGQQTMVQNYTSDSFYSFARPDMQSMLLIRSLFNIEMFQNDLNALGGIFQIERCQNCTVFCDLTRILQCLTPGNLFPVPSASCHYLFYGSIVHLLTSLGQCCHHVNNLVLLLTSNLFYFSV